MDLRQLEYVVAVADEQHFTRAASLCRVSQSGLSSAIRSLESELGAALFTRTTRQVTPTEAGLALLPFARSMLAQATAGRDAVERTREELSGSLRIGAEQCLGVVDVPRVLERFHRRHPLVDIRFTQAGSHEVAEGVRSGALDIGFLATAEHLGAMHHWELGARAIVLVCAADHPLAARRDPLSWSDLDDLEFVDFQESWGVRTLNDGACAKRSVRRRVRCTVDDVHTLLELVQRGLGVAMVPSHVAQKPQAAGLVVLDLPERDAPAWTVSVVAPRSLTTAASRMLDVVRADDGSVSPAA